MNLDPIENKVANSGLVTLELEKFVSKEPIIGIDIKANLWEGIALREKDFRQFISEQDWAAYKNKNVAVFCSADAIVPNWAYMLIASILRPHTTKVHFGSIQSFKEILVLKAIEKIEPNDYLDQRVIIKGCGDESISYAAYGAIAFKLTPFVKSLMFGEPCSTVPIYKKAKK